MKLFISECFLTDSFGKQLATADILLFENQDMPKLHRCTELLSMNEELKQARKAFEVDEEKLATAD